MDIELTPMEARVIGCLLEKEKTTPDQYPMSINGLTNACNQKSNRDPVLNLSEGDVQQAVDELVKRRLVSEASGFGARVVKVQHRFCNTEFGDLKFSEQELAIVCLLLLRGPQTPGELRTRSNRLASFHDVHEVEQLLQHMMDREDGPFVVRLPREPGKRESRYAHLFSGEVDVQSIPQHAPPLVEDDRLSQLESEVATLRAEVAELRAQLAESS